MQLALNVSEYNEQKNSVQNNIEAYERDNQGLRKRKSPLSEYRYGVTLFISNAQQSKDNDLSCNFQTKRK